MKETYVSQQFIRGHAGDDEEVPQDNLEIVGPELAQRSPQFLDVGVRVGELKQRQINMDFEIAGITVDKLVSIFHETGNKQ